MAMELGVRQPRLLAPGEGEAVTDRAERTVRSLLEHELMDVSWSRYEPGERGPEAHVHREHADVWFVLSGELTFELGPAAEKVAAPAGTLVLVPQNVIHSFGNESSGTTTYLNIHAPSCGFAAHLHGDDTHWDNFDPPADGGRTVSDVVVSRPGDGNLVTVGTIEILYKAEGSDGDGTLFAGESTLPPHTDGPPPHIHDRHVDTFFVLDGTLTMLLDESEVEAPAGSYAAVPPGSVHTFRNRSDAPVRVLYLMAPGGFEQSLKEIAAGAPPLEVLARYDFRMP